MVWYIYLNKVKLRDSILEWVTTQYGTQMCKTNDVAVNNNNNNNEMTLANKQQHKHDTFFYVNQLAKA
jgi:hypothetical protein